MDPNTALENALEALEDYRETARTAKKAEAAERLADAFEALHGWLHTGGFLPRAWSRQDLTTD